MNHDTASWLSFHLYADDARRQDEILVRVVAPFVEAETKAGRLGRFFFLRYGEGGAHLRLRLRPASRPGKNVAAELARRAREAFASAGPIEEKPYCRSTHAFGETLASVYGELANEQTSALALDLLRGPLGEDRPRRFLALVALLDRLVALSSDDDREIARRLDAGRDFARRAAREHGLDPVGGDVEPWAEPARTARERLAPRLETLPRVHRLAHILRRLQRAAPVTEGDRRVEGSFVAVHALHLLANKLGYSLPEEHTAFTLLASMPRPTFAPIEPSEDSDMSQTRHDCPEDALTWRAYHLHHADLDRLILEVVDPFFAEHGERFERRYWLRHYAGGSHLRVRLRAEAATLDDLGPRLTQAAEAFFEQRPSEKDSSYDPARAEALLEKEGLSVDDPEILHYRVDEVVERPYAPGEEGVFVSDDAAELMNDFRHDVQPLATALLRRSDRHLQILRLYFYQAIVNSGDLPNGSVSWKSHWEGFASVFPNEEALDRIRETYEARRDVVAEVLREVRIRHEADEIAEDPILLAWRELADEYRSRTRTILAEGRHLTYQPETAEEADENRSSYFAAQRRESDFTNAFWSNDRFLVSMRHEPAFLVPRVLTNLFYDLVSRVGLNALEKMTLCHHAHRAVEDEFDVDLTEILESSVERIANRHAPENGETLAAGG